MEPLKKYCAIFFIITCLLPACGGRLPSAKSAQSITRSFFKNYSHKYKSSLFGSHKVTRVEINRIQEEARQLAEVDALLGFDSGEQTRVLLTLKKKPPFGWHVLSWERIN